MITGRLISLSFSVSAARGFGVNEVMADVVSLVSHATEARLRSTLENVSALARHRTDPSKVRTCYLNVSMSDEQGNGEKGI